MNAKKVAWNEHRSGVGWSRLLKEFGIGIGTKLVFFRKAGISIGSFGFSESEPEFCPNLTKSKDYAQNF